MSRQHNATARRQPTQHRDHCPQTGKIRYRDSREATDALHRLTNQAALADALGGEHTIEVRRKYTCNACRGWHLTSQETWGTGREQNPASWAAPAMPAPRREDPLMSALARSTGRLRHPDLGLAA